MDHLRQVTHQRGLPLPIAGHHQVADHPFHPETPPKETSSSSVAILSQIMEPGIPANPPDPLMQALR
jgi:hypothetical protein